jgi:hypothetical protein
MELTMEIVQDIPLSRFADLLVSAFEGGSNYWYNIESFKKPEKFTELCGHETAEEAAMYRHMSYAVNPGGAIVVSDRVGCEEGDTVTKAELNLSVIRVGAILMAKQYPLHWANFVSGNDDAETGDVFLQCCVFGKIIYG